MGKKTEKCLRDDVMIHDVRFNNLVDSENYEMIGLVSRRVFPVHAEVTLLGSRYHHDVYNQYLSITLTTGTVTCTSTNHALQA